MMPFGRSTRRLNYRRLLNAAAPTGSRQAGFTLLEMLIVVAIIALLVAILLPSVNRVKENARLTNCQTNLRQIGIVVQTYATSYHDCYPYPGNYGDVWKPCPEYLLFLSKQVKEHGIFICPSDQQKTYDETVLEYGWWTAGKFWPPPTSVLTRKRHVRHMWRFDRNWPPVSIDWMEGSYIWCEHVVGDYDEDGRPVKQAQVHTPAALGLLSEGRNVVNRGDWGSLRPGAGDCRLDQIHLKDRVNMLYADGHVDIVFLDRVNKVNCDPSKK
jgi:prepilin-type N-terminal cleavage/methylation domain-containing protein/prepilin-type processing-associated H-X9-DG protein